MLEVGFQRSPYFGWFIFCPITVNSSIDIGVPSSHPTKSDSIEYWILSDSLDWLKGNLTAKRHILMGKSMVSCNQSAEQNPSSEQWMVARMVSETVMRVIPLCRKASCFIWKKHGFRWRFSLQPLKNARRQALLRPRGGWIARAQGWTLVRFRSPKTIYTVRI